MNRLLEAAAPPQPFDGPPPRHLADEGNLVTRWLESTAGKAELLGVQGRLASPAIGGALLQLRYDRPGRHRHAWPRRARPSRKPAPPAATTPARSPPPPVRPRARLAGYCRVGCSLQGRR